MRTVNGRLLLDAGGVTLSAMLAPRGSAHGPLKTACPTTSISNGTATAAVNANFASALGLNADVEFGNGSTSAQTGGTAFGSSYNRS